MLSFLTFLLKFQGCSQRLSLKMWGDVLILHLVSLALFLRPDTDMEEIFLSCPIALGIF